MANKFKEPKKNMVQDDTTLLSLNVGQFKKVLASEMILQKEVLNIDELSTYINMAKSTIYKKVQGDKIPYIKKGKMLYFNREAINVWLNEGDREDWEKY